MIDLAFEIFKVASSFTDVGCAGLVSSGSRR